jgi:hypothetical protein
VGTAVRGSRSSRLDLHARGGGGPPETSRPSAHFPYLRRVDPSHLYFATRDQSIPLREAAVACRLEGCRRCRVRRGRLHRQCRLHCFGIRQVTHLRSSSVRTKRSSIIRFEKSAGALGAAGPRWDPFVNARAIADLVKIPKGDGLGARGTHHARAWWT